MEMYELIKLASYLVFYSFYLLESRLYSYQQNQYAIFQFVKKDNWINYTFIEIKIDQKIRFKDSYYQQDKTVMSHVMNEHTGNNVVYDQPMYRPSQRITSWFFRDTFDLRFNEIRDSLVDYGLFRIIYHMLRWRFNYVNQGIPPETANLEEQLPVQKPTFPIKDDKITYTWIGHSTAVISFGQDGNFLIDPVFSERCSPYQWIGPKRIRPLPCTIDQLPEIHVVLVSHDHYDHLDENALQNLFRRFPNCQFFAGLNSEDVFPRECKMNTMDWTQTKQLRIKNKKFKITFVPVCHWSRRGAFDKKYRLWGGFVIESPTGKKVFYSGDTGYCSIFGELGHIFKEFDLCILPIGAYKPRQYLRNQHIDPEQAVTVHLELNSKKSVGVHWGTFPLGFQHYTGARTDLIESLKNRNLDPNSFITVNHGGHFQVDYL